MLELILLASGFALLIFCSMLPHENTDGVATILFSRLKFKRGHPKLRLDLPKTTELLWKSSVELRKVPLVLDERNKLTLKLLPMSGDRLGANVEVPLTSTAELRNISVEVITATFDVERIGHPLLFSISSATEATFRITPRVLGDGQIRFEFWQGENRRLFRFCVSGDNQLFSLERTRLCHRLDPNCSTNY